MSLETKSDEITSAAVAESSDVSDSDRRYRSSEVAMILGRRWQVPCEREALAKLSDSLGFETRSTPNGKRSWSLAQIDEIARVLRARHVGDFLSRSAVELREADQIHRLVDDVFAEMPSLGLSATAA